MIFKSLKINKIHKIFLGDPRKNSSRRDGYKRKRPPQLAPRRTLQPRTNLPHHSVRRLVKGLMQNGCQLLHLFQFRIVFAFGPEDMESGSGNFSIRNCLSFRQLILNEFWEARAKAFRGSLLLPSFAGQGSVWDLPKDGELGRMTRHSGKSSLEGDRNWGKSGPSKDHPISP